MVDVIMPKMGESITEGTVLEWKKSVGDIVVKDETLLEISTDKVDSEVPSPAAGKIIEIIAKVNDTIPVGEVIARIGDIDETSLNKNSQDSTDGIKQDQTTRSYPEVPNKIDPVIKMPATKSRDRFYSPLVKSIAKVENISQPELDAIQGSGKGGRVNKADILKYIAAKDQNLTAEETLAGTFHKQAPTSMLDKVEPMSRMRKKIAKHMVESIKTSPHVYTTVEADVTNLVNIRAKNKDSFKHRTGDNLTYTPMLLEACIRVIQEFPIMNASIEGNNIVHHQNINMGVAVALPDDNLIVPVIRCAEEKNFLGLVRSTVDLSRRARAKNLNPDEIFGSTFTITNPGIFGGLFGMGIINQPNVGILAVGSFHKRPVVKETEYGDTIVVRHMVYLTLSYDHRIIDGACGTKFLSRLVELIESYDENRVNN